jgi:hypothetical protein
LCGFVEAEGCFCTRKNKTKSFSIGQKRNKNVIEVIKSFFDLKNKVQEKANDFYFIETYNKASLGKIIYFFNRYSLKGYCGERFNDFKEDFKHHVS